MWRCPFLILYCTFGIFQLAVFISFHFIWLYRFWNATHHSDRSAFHASECGWRIHGFGVFSVFLSYRHNSTRSKHPAQPTNGITRAKRALIKALENWCKPLTLVSWRVRFFLFHWLVGSFCSHLHVPHVLVPTIWEFTKNINLKCCAWIVQTIFESLRRRRAISMDSKSNGGTEKQKQKKRCYRLFHSYVENVTWIWWTLCELMVKYNGTRQYCGCDQQLDSLGSKPKNNNVKRNTKQTRRST